MAGVSRSRASSRHDAATFYLFSLVFGLVLFVCCARAEPNFTCPDYVATHAPLIWLHSQDSYLPSDLQVHLEQTLPALDQQPVDGLPEMNLDNLEILNQFGNRISLTSKEDPLTHPKWIMGEAPDETGRIHNSTACVVIIVEKDEVELDAFYFYFYSYNEGPNITQVLEPFNKIVEGEKAASGMHFGNHVGDWEHNMVRFREGKPVGIYFSQHIDGAAYDWDDWGLNVTEDGRPIVYSALGSHANYAAAGEQVHNAVLIDYCDEGKRWDPVLSAYFYRFDPKTYTLSTLSPPGRPSTSPPSQNLTSFFYFNGHWGDWQYPNDDPRQETIPKFKIKRWQTGPTGPRHKHLIRRGLKPDHPRPISWTEWAVGIYMKLYPCCLKGWRAWFTTGVIIVLLSGIVMAFVVAVRLCRGYRQARYTRLQAEEIPMEEWQRDEEAYLSASDDDEGTNKHKD